LNQNGLLRPDYLAKQETSSRSRFGLVEHLLFGKVIRAGETILIELGETGWGKSRVI